MNPFIHFASILALAVWGVTSALAQTALSPAQQAQREEIKRQEAVIASQKAIDEADQLAIRGKLEEARGIVERVIANQSPAGEGAAVVENAQKLLTQISLKQGFDALKARNYLVAQQLAREVLGFEPRNPNGLRLLEEANAAMGLPIDKPDARNPAIDERFITNVNRVTDLLKLGRDQAGTGQFEKAERTFEQVLAIDPDNVAAARELQAVRRKMGAASELARKVSQQDKLIEVRQNWAERFVPEAQLEAATTATQPIRRSNRFGITEKLRTLIIPEINFQPGTTIDDAASFLTLRSRDVDPTKEGVSFLVKNEQARNEAKPFSLQLQNVPLGEALRYITLLAGIKSRTEEFAVFFVPLSDRSENLVRREFKVQQDFFDTAPEAGAAQPGPAGGVTRRRAAAAGTAVDTTAGSTARRALEARGVEFPEGATAVYSPTTGILTVLNTQDQIDYIEELVTNTTDADTLMVRVETRFIEINQEDLDELNFNYALQGIFTGDGILGSPSDITNGSVTAQTAFQGAEGLGRNQIGQLLNQFPTTVVDVGVQQIDRSQFMARGLLNGNQFAIVVDALSQKKSFNIVTAPSILINDKSTGTINVSREFRFPTTFDAPQIQERVIAGVVRTPTVIPSWPSGFGQAPGDDGFEEVGVVATVTPEIQPTNQTIRVQVNPTIIQFDGFINYGTPISDPGDQTSLPPRPPGLISENVIRIPVFSRRSIERSTVEIRDGYTLVMGGLIQEKTDTLEEKFPILGDIPFVGRFFRSNAERSVKRNLLIFITVRIIRPNGDPLNVLPGELASR